MWIGKVVIIIVQVCGEICLFCLIIVHNYYGIIVYRLGAHLFEALRRPSRLPCSKFDRGRKAEETGARFAPLYRILVLSQRTG